MSSDTASPDPSPSEPDIFSMKTDTYCMLLHLSQLLGGTFVGFAVPIVLNWLISLLIYMFAAGLLCTVLVGFLILPVLFVLAVVFPIIGAVKANEGVVWKYPLSIAFFK